MVAYISRIVYPDPAANSVQTIQMAAALAQLSGSTGLFVHDLSAPEETVRSQYGIEGSPLKIWRMHTRRWPGPVYNQAALRFTTYNSGVAAVLGLHPAWRGLPGHSKVLFVRSRLEILYWGLMRPYLPWLRGWLFACEIHDLPEGEEAVADSYADAGQRPGWRPGRRSLADRRARRMAEALARYDLVITVNQALADDVSRLTGGRVQSQVAPLCSGLARLPHPPAAARPANSPAGGSGERVVISYFGTIDLGHGIDTAVQAMQYLPSRFVLRLTGRVRDDARVWVEAGQHSGRVEWVGPVPYAQMASEIDACDVALVPAGGTVHATRYRSPLKIFDAMLRGKPILAADVDCHRELLTDGVNALFYRSGDARDLAARLEALAANPQLAGAVARAAWAESGAYTYPARAQVLLDLMNDVKARQQSGKAVYA